MMRSMLGSLALLAFGAFCITLVYYPQFIHTINAFYNHLFDVNGPFALYIAIWQSDYHLLKLLIIIPACFFIYCLFTSNR